MAREMTVSAERFPIAGRFAIARGARTEAVVVTVTLGEGAARGRGECVPYARYGETVESVCDLLEMLRPRVESGLDRFALQDLLPPGAARNALDCALWDLDAKLSGVPAYVTAGLDRIGPVTTAYTISLDEPGAMAAKTAEAAGRPILKIKLGGAEGDLERIAAVRRSAPNAVLIADANEGWTEENVDRHLRALGEHGYALVEQPLRAGQDGILRELRRDIPVCADESLHDRRDLPKLRGLYDAVNVKLDKAGGLTEALRLAADAQALGFRLMIGCMVGTSLAMAPAMLLAGRAHYVDLDGPLLLARDRPEGLRYVDSTVYPPAPALWG